MNAIRRSFILLFFFVTVPTHAEWYSDTQDKMGTRVEVRLWHDNPVIAEQLLSDSMAEFDRIEAAMSTYRAESEISNLNAHGAEGWVEISTELFDLIRRALKLSVTTGGAFDITYDSVGDLYDFRERIRPTEADIEARLDTIDFRFVELDTKKSRVRFSRQGVRINLGGIAKGYSVESVIGLLRRAGVEHALASAGGDTRLLGDRGGQPWIVGVRDPEQEDGIVTRLGLEDEAVSTSGDYERFFVEDGIRYHHILNPSTGKSASLVRSATVIGADATLTDGLSTSVFVLGPDEGLKLIETLPGYEALIIDNSFKVLLSSGLDPR
jgi:thiamine biosynthesis lipoprotein